MCSRLALSVTVIYLFATISNAKVCCDIKDRDNTIGGACREGCACCPDGTWVGSIGDAKTYPCNDGQNTLVVGVDDDKFGEVCSTTTTETPTTTETCCKQDNMPLCLIGVAACCPDNTWACSNDGVGNTYLCGSDTLTAGTDTFGEVCPTTTTDTPSTTTSSACCDINDRDNTIGGACREGCACCPDGTWIGSIGDAKTYPCNDGKNTLVVGVDDDKFGEICPTTTASIDTTTATGKPDTTTTAEPETTETSSTCCDINDRDNSIGGACREGCACCPDGTWIGSIGDAKTYPCNDGKNTLVVGADKFGEICPTTTETPTTETCCKQDIMPLCLIGVAACCPDNTWACSNDGIGNTYLCGSDTLTAGKDTFGEVCTSTTTETPRTDTPTTTTSSTCCDINDRDNSIGGVCREGCACCPDGTWIGSIGDAKTYPCNGGKNTLVVGVDDDKFGEICPTTTAIDTSTTEKPDTTTTAEPDTTTTAEPESTETSRTDPETTKRDEVTTTGKDETTTEDERSCDNDDDCDDGYSCKFRKGCVPPKWASQTTAVGNCDGKGLRDGVCVKDADYCDVRATVNAFTGLACFSNRGAIISAVSEWRKTCKWCLCKEEGERDCFNLNGDDYEGLAALDDTFVEEIFNKICNKETYPDLEDGSGDQCPWLQIRFKDASLIDECWCNALVCYTNVNYDKVGVFSGVKQHGMMVVIVFIMGIISWM